MNNRIYNKQNAEGGAIVSEIVTQLAEDLARMPQKADLKNTAQIERICISYVDACAKAGAIPSKIGLARALGMSRRTVDYFMERHPEHPTAQLLEIVFDAFSEALSTAALAGATNNIFSIFVSKALYKWKDTVSIEAVPPDPFERRTAADIVAKWSKEQLDMLPD